MEEKWEVFQRGKILKNLEGKKQSKFNLQKQKENLWKRKHLNRSLNQKY